MRVATVITKLSKVAKHRVGWKCEWCGTRLIEAGGQLAGSHFISRGSDPKRAIIDPENIDSLCHHHHSYLEEHRSAYSHWKRRLMGQWMFRALRERSRATGFGMDVEGVNQWCKDQLRYYAGELTDRSGVSFRYRAREVRAAARMARGYLERYRFTSWYDELTGCLVLHVPESLYAVVLTLGETWLLSPGLAAQCIDVAKADRAEELHAIPF